MSESTTAPATTDTIPEIDESLAPAEGWHVLHLFYQIDRSQWSMLTSEEQVERKTALTRLVQELRQHPNTQLLMFSMLTPRADIGFMLLTPDLRDANAFEKRLTISMGPDVLVPIYSYFSMTERSEYTTSAEQYGETLRTERGLVEGSDEFNTAIAEFNARMEKYGKDRLYPNMPDWPVFCFYPMTKRRSGADNWYSLDFETRRQLMAGHAAIGRQWAGKIRQLITGSTGLDDYEWGVTLFAKDTFDVKGIVYEMRFDEVSARYAEFGDFYIGIQVRLQELFQQVSL
ncbi:MAG: hydrogen peroxide-dependent heme synthase [Verrucomicrobiales bacterium]|nr:heme-dependent peroxidase [Verrucomicrobiae bacterium]